MASSRDPDDVEASDASLADHFRSNYFFDNLKTTFDVITVEVTIIYIMVITLFKYLIHF